jgi:hypothetical protein
MARVRSLWLDLMKGIDMQQSLVWRAQRLSLWKGKDKDCNQKAKTWILRMNVWPWATLLHLANGLHIL